MCENVFRCKRHDAGVWVCVCACVSAMMFAQMCQMEQPMCECSSWRRRQLLKLAKKKRKKERKIPTVLFTLIIFFVSLNVKMICCNTRVNEFIFCQQELNWTRLFLFYGRWIIQSWCLWSFGQRPNGVFFIILFFKCSSFTADLNIYSVWWVGRQLHT